MAINVKFTTDDFLQSVITKKAVWLPLDIEKVDVQPSADGASINYIVDFRVIENGANADMNRVPIRKFFNEKFLAAMIPYANALGTPISKEGGDFDFHGTAGKKVMGFVKPGKMGDRDINDISDFKPIGG